MAFVLLSICAYLQVLILPGLIATKIIKVKGTIRAIIFTFAYSLIINHFLVFGLVLMGGMYSRSVMLFIIFIEIFILIGILRNTYRGFLPDHFNHFKIGLRQAYITLLTKRSFVEWICFIFSALTYFLCLVVMLWFVRRFVDNLGTPFFLTDAKQYWYQASLAWLDNQWNTPLYHPPLIPINSSLMYLITATKHQFLPKQFMPLFSIFILLTHLDLAITRKKIGYFWGMIATGAMLEKYGFPFTVDGYVDIPAAFFAFLAIYCIILHKGQTSENRKYLINGAFIAVGAGITKATGMYIVAVYPFLAYLLSLRYQTSKTKLFLVILGILSLSSPLYLYKSIVLKQNFEQKSLVTSPIVDACEPCRNTLSSYYHRSRLKEKLGWIFNIALFTVFGILLLSIFDKRRWILLLIAIPYSMLWCFYANYDIRNWFLAFPFIGLCFGIGKNQLLRFISQIFQIRELRSEIP